MKFALLLPLLAFSCGVKALVVFEHKQGSCTYESGPDGNCILSANYPNDYSANDFCRFYVKYNGYLKVMFWDVESDDWMKVCSPTSSFSTTCKTTASVPHEILYSSNGGPDAVRIRSTPVSKMDHIMFKSNSVNQGKGFKVCWMSSINRCTETDGSTINSFTYCLCGKTTCTESKGLFCTASSTSDSDAKCSPLKSCRSVDDVGGVVLWWVFTTELTFCFCLVSFSWGFCFSLPFSSSSSFSFPVFIFLSLSVTTARPRGSLQIQPIAVVGQRNALKTPV